MFSVVETRDGLVTEFAGAPSGQVTGETAPLMFTGIQILEPRIFDYIPRGVFSHSTVDIYPQAIARGERIAAHVTEGMWYELSTIPRYLEISLRLLSDQGRNVDMGEDCRVQSGAAISDAILWDRVTIEGGARVHHSILADGVRIANGEVIEDSAVVLAWLVRAAERPAKALRGEFKGDNFVVPLTR